jgi:hypothetical protein
MKANANLRSFEIHCANIRGARTRRQAFARYHAYMRVTTDESFRFALGCELTCKLHRLDASNATIGKRAERERIA